jgi:D-3-phosphoglycerate dehydrogenase
MKVLVADKFEKSGIDGLTAIGCEVLNQPDLVDQALVDAIQSLQPAVLVVRSTKVPEAAMGPSLKLIVRAGAGVNTIDIKAATAKGIKVANCPGKNAIAVAELAIGLMLSLDRRIPDNVADLRAGKWNKKEYSKARGLYGMTLGILGAGAIGCEVIKRAAAFGMPVVMWSRRFDGQRRQLTPAEAEELGLTLAVQQVPIMLAQSPVAVAERCDVLSVHVGLGPGTKGFVNRDLLCKMRPGSFVINTARGDVVDAASLLEAIKDRKIKVGLDVFSNEPSASAGDFDDPIVHQPGVVGTHHIGASTDQAQEAIAAETVRIVKSFKDSGEVPNAVN